MFYIRTTYYKKSNKKTVSLIYSLCDSNAHETTIDETEEYIREHDFFTFFESWRGLMGAREFFEICLKQGAVIEEYQTTEYKPPLLSLI